MDERRLTAAERDPRTPADSPLTREDIRASEWCQDLSTPKIAAGDVAPDFALPLHDFTTGQGRAAGRTVTLHEHTGREPVALVFGSYT